MSVDTENNEVYDELGKLINSVVPDVKEIEVSICYAY